MKISNELDVLRSKIDDIDEQLVSLLAYRFEISQEIGEYKKMHSLSVEDTIRFQKVLSKVADFGKKYGISQKWLQGIWGAIHEESKRYQK